MTERSCWEKLSPHTHPPQCHSIMKAGGYFPKTKNHLEKGTPSKWTSQRVLLPRQQYSKQFEIGFSSSCAAAAVFFLVAGGNSRGKRDYLLAFDGIVRFFLCRVAFPWLIFSENVRRLRSGWELLGFVGRPLESHWIVGHATRDGMRCTGERVFPPGHVVRINFRWKNAHAENGFDLRAENSY